MMQLPVQVTFRNMDPSPAIEARLRKKAAKLERFFDRIIACRVSVEAPHRHHRKGRLYKVHVSLTVPGREIAVTHDHPLDHAHEDVYVAIRDAFDAAARRLEDHARSVRGDVKAHALPQHGRVRKLLPEYGFIETSEGLEVYFHRNSVAERAFDSLTLGQEVRFALAEGESAKGPQATTVTPVGKHHLVD